MRHLSRILAPFLVSTFLAASAYADVVLPPEEAAKDRPNIIVVLFDDLALTDLGAYGGEARTPVIDGLASSGAQFTRYYTSPLCSPSRAMLLTGIDNHRNGVATIPEVLPPEHEGRPGYSLHLEPGVATIATRLKAEGYRTYMTGKWHLGDGDGQLPNAHGFDRSFTLDASGADNWEDKAYIPYYAEAPWYEDGKPADLPENFYSSDFITSKMIEYLGAGSDEPFFAYLAFQAVHIPVQAPREMTEAYAGQFEQGWNALQTARFERAKALGIIPATATPPAMHPRMRQWSDLSAEDQAIAARAMQVYSAMIESVDRNLGRLIEHLKASGEWDNTIIIVTSDNGPEPSNPMEATGFDLWMATHGYDRTLETLGERGSMNFIGREWASAVAAPGSLFKFYTSEGGIHVPLVIAGPGVTPGMRSVDTAFVSDIAPTILELTGTSPDLEGAMAMTGRSLAPALRDAAARIRPGDEPVGIEVSGNAALFSGEYKIVHNALPYGDGAWHLYNVVADPGETRDLKEAEPERFAAMTAQYQSYVATMGVLPLPEGYNIHKQVETNTLKRMASQYWLELTIIGIILLALIYGLVRLVMRLARRRAA